VAFGYGENKAYPDTTIFFSKPNGFTKSYGYQITPTNEPLVEIIDQISSDTLSVYYFHSDTLAKYSWEEIRRDYKVLRRYDLSVEDVKKLYNKYSVPEIPYPPDARMKDMKMWPPYETK
jgi:hypothetical protein